MPLPGYSRLVAVTSNPAALGEIGMDASGRLCYYNGSRLVPIPDEIESNTFTYQGKLAVATGVSRWYIEAACTWQSGRLAVNTAPSGSSVIVDVLKNGSTIFTTSANKPTLAAGAFSQLSATPDLPNFSAGDYLQISITTIDSGATASDLTYTPRLRRT